MKKIIKTLLSWFVSVWSKVYSYNTSMRIIKWKNRLYTKWLRFFVGELPQDSLIAYPCSLQGGGAKHIYLGNNTCIHSHCILGSWVKYGDDEFNPTVKIGNNCSIGEYTQITACNKITIGDGLLTGRYVYIGDNSHGGLSLEEASVPPSRRKLISKGEVMIGNNVWIGDKVTILGGVTIGDNAIIGANSVVTRDVPSNCMAVGSPVKIVKVLSK